MTSLTITYKIIPDIKENAINKSSVLRSIKILIISPTIMPDIAEVANKYFLIDLVSISGFS